jgi:hypothetical protein
MPKAEHEMIQRTILAGVAVAIAFAGVSCSSTNSSSPDKPLPFAAASGGPSESIRAQAAESSVRIPVGAMYTIACATFSGPDHVAIGQAMKARLMEIAALKAMKDWYLVHSNNQTVLYYGFYGDTDADTREARQDAERFRTDRKAISSLMNLTTNERLFPLAAKVPLDRDSADGPPQWNLVASKGVWTLAVATFVTGNRRLNAVDCCKRARELGYEAYYHHGDAASSVYIGSWPEQALKVTTTRQEAEDPNQPVLVLGPGMPQVSGRVVMGKEEMAVVQQKVEILDPSMRQAIRECPYHAIDGELLKRKQRIGTEFRMVPDASFLVRIPGRAELTTPPPPRRTTLDPSAFR